MKNAKRGILISFEGTEGSGKSTLIREVLSLLNANGFPAIQTREPGGSSVAERIRSLILESDMNPWTELFLYEAARAEHAAQTILPALDSGKVVLCDRFIHSTLAYQAYSRGLPWKNVKSLNKMATFGIRPDLTILLDIDPETGLRRAQDPNRFEAEGVEFQKRVRKGFLKAKAEEPSRWLVLKVDQKSPEQLAQAVLKEMRKRFKNKLFKGGMRNHG